MIRDELADNPFLKAVFDSMPEMIFVIDSETRVQAINNRVKNLLRAPDVDVTGKDIGVALSCIQLDGQAAGCGFLPVCSQCVIRNTAIEALAQNKPIYNREGSLSLTIDKIPWTLDILVNCVPASFDDSHFAVLTISDITDLKTLERNRTADLERLAMIGAASTSIVHDIENPLTGISGFAKLLEVGLDSADNLDYCLEIQKGVARIRKMTTEILALASGKQDTPLEIKEVNLGEFFSDLLSQMRLDGNVVLNLDYKDTVAIDEGKFRRVIWNVIKNANEALQNIDHGKIEIACNASNDFVIICISDNGPGIPAEIADKLFLPGQSFGKKYGRGFGLFSSKRIVEAHRSELWFNTAPGQGTSFFIKLPRNKTAAPDSFSKL